MRIHVSIRDHFELPAISALRRTVATTWLAALSAWIPLLVVSAVVARVAIRAVAGEIDGAVAVDALAIGLLAGAVPASIGFCVMASAGLFGLSIEDAWARGAVRGLVLAPVALVFFPVVVLADRGLPGPVATFAAALAAAIWLGVALAVNAGSLRELPTTLRARVADGPMLGAWALITTVVLVILQATAGSAVLGQVMALGFGAVAMFWIGATTMFSLVDEDESGVATKDAAADSMAVTGTVTGATEAGVAVDPNLGFSGVAGQVAGTAAPPSKLAEGALSGVVEPGQSLGEWVPVPTDGCEVSIVLEWNDAAPFELHLATADGQWMQTPAQPTSPLVAAVPLSTGWYYVCAINKLPGHARACRITWSVAASMPGATALRAA